MTKTELQDMLADNAELMVIFASLYGVTHHELREKHRALDIIRAQNERIKMKLEKLKLKEGESL